MQLHVGLPMLAPAAITSFALALARSVGERGAVVFVAGNLPGVIQIAPLLTVIRLEEFEHGGAVAIAMLAVSFALLLAINLIQTPSRCRMGLV